MNTKNTYLDDLSQKIHAELKKTSTLISENEVKNNLEIFQKLLPIDLQYCLSKEKYLADLISKSYDSIILSEKTKNSIKNLGSSSLLYASVHKSHFDYVALCFKFFTEGLPYPRTVSGENLLNGFIGFAVRQFLGFDLKKAGAVPIKRASVSKDLINVCKTIECLLEEDNSVLIFPEYEEIKINDSLYVRTGRSYSGEIRQFASALFTPAINAVKKTDKNVFVIPIAISYDFIAEEKFYPYLQNVNTLKKSKSFFKSLYGNIFYSFLEAIFFLRMFNLGSGNIYIDSGEPIQVLHNMNKKELALLAYEEASKSYRVNATSLISYCMNKKNYFRQKLVDSVLAYAYLLKSQGYNVSDNALNPYSIYDTLEKMRERSLLSGINYIQNINPRVILFYSNTIKHLVK